MKMISNLCFTTTLYFPRPSQKTNEQWLQPGEQGCHLFLGPFPHFDEFFSYFSPKLYWLFPGFPHKNNTFFQNFPRNLHFLLNFPRFPHFLRSGNPEIKQQWRWWQHWHQRLRGRQRRRRHQRWQRLLNGLWWTILGQFSPYLLII